MKIYFTRRFLTQSNFKVYLNRLEIFVSLLSGALKYSPDVDSCHYFSVDGITGRERLIRTRLIRKIPLNSKLL